MIKGFVSRRASQRIPFQTDIGIQFAIEGKESIMANTTNLSPEGVRFFLPKGQIRLTSEEIIELVFCLPNQGEIAVQGEICYFSNAVDGDQRPVVYYGVKFINITPAIWNSINDFCQSRLNKLTEGDLDNASDENVKSSIPVQKSVKQSTANQLEISKPDFNPSFSNPDPIQKDNLKIKTSESANVNKENNEDLPYHSLSQDLIDQIIKSMTPTEKTLPDHPFPVVEETSATMDSVQQEEALIAEEMERLNTEKALEEIKKIADSINLKIDEEFFHNTGNVHSTDKPFESLPLENEKIDRDPMLKADKSTDSVTQSQPADLTDSFNFNILDSTIGQKQEESLNKLPDFNFFDFTDHPASDSNEAPPPYKSISPNQSNLIDVLYGEQTLEPAPGQPAKTFAQVNKETTKPDDQKSVEKLNEKPEPEPELDKIAEQQEVYATNHSDGSEVMDLVNSVTDSKPTQPKSPKINNLHPSNTQKIQNLYGSSLKNGSSVSMDQRMIDQIIQSLTKK